MTTNVLSVNLFGFNAMATKSLRRTSAITSYHIICHRESPAVLFSKIERFSHNLEKWFL